MAQGPSVLIIDEDPAIRRLLCRELSAAGYRVHELAPAQSPLAGAESQFDLLMFDIDAPAGGGVEAIRMVREHSPVSVVALSARTDDDATVGALDSGADDYIRKPFSAKEVLARVRNALRRKAREEGKPAPLVTGDLEIDLLLRRVRVRGEDVYLSARPYAVLQVLAEHAGKALTHEELLSSVWAERGVKRIQNLRVAIRELRGKLEVDPAHPRYIVTEPWVGYRLEIREREHRGLGGEMRTSGQKSK